MRLFSALLLASLAFSAHAETVYVTDKLYLGVYKERGKGQFTSISSGTALEVLERGKSWLRAKLPNGKEGWVKTKYLVEKVPAAIRVTELEKELAALRAAGGQAGAGGEELEGLQAEKASLVDRLEGKELELEALRAQLTEAQASTATTAAVDEQAAGGDEAATERLAQAEAAAESARQAEQQALSQAKTLGAERDQLQQQNQQQEAELQRLRGQINGALAALGSGEAAVTVAMAPVTETAVVSSEPSAAGFLAQLGVQRHVHALYLALAAAMLAIGFWLGIRWLDHRIRQRHGGFQVW